MTKKPKTYSTGTKIPRFELIPRAALVSLVNRYEIGEAKYKDLAWNGLSKNQEAADDKAMVIARLGHVIDHAYKAIDILAGNCPDDGDDNAGAIMWGGSLLAAHMARKAGA